MNPAKPSALKLIQGTYRKDRVARNEPKPRIEIPETPKHLTGEALEEWQRITPDLERLGLMTRIDRSALAAYCECWANWVLACESCANTGGPVIQTTAGNLMENPWYSIKKRSAELMHKFLVEFGMTPASRTKIDASPLPAGKADNPFAAIK